MTLRLLSVFLGAFPFLVGFQTLIPGPVQAVEYVYFNETEVLEVAFEEEDRVVPVALGELTDVTKWSDMAKRAKYSGENPFMKCYQGSKGGQVISYACIDNVIGKSKPITYLLKINHPGGAIDLYRVMVYREAVGREVRRGPFQEQFYGKTVDSTLLFGYDLRNISGATLSSKSLRSGFRRLLTVYDLFMKDLPLLETHP